MPTNITQWIEEKKRHLMEFDIAKDFPETFEALAEWLEYSLREAINLGREDFKQQIEIAREQGYQDGLYDRILKEILHEYEASKSDYSGPTKDLVEIIKSKIV